VTVGINSSVVTSPPFGAFSDKRASAAFAGTIVICLALRFLIWVREQYRQNLKNGKRDQNPPLPFEQDHNPVLDQLFGKLFITFPVVCLVWLLCVTYDIRDISSLGK
jgi:hypothetical protein